jgi:hypothetical protein
MVCPYLKSVIGRAVKGKDMAEQRDSQPIKIEQSDLRFSLQENGSRRQMTPSLQVK